MQPRPPKTSLFLAAIAVLLPGAGVASAQDDTKPKTSDYYIYVTAHPSANHTLRVRVE